MWVDRFLSEIRFLVIFRSGFLGALSSTNQYKGRHYRFFLYVGTLRRRGRFLLLRRVRVFAGWPYLRVRSSEVRRFDGELPSKGGGVVDHSILPPSERQTRGRFIACARIPIPGWGRAFQANCELRPDSCIL